MVLALAYGWSRAHHLEREWEEAWRLVVEEMHLYWRCLYVQKHINSFRDMTLADYTIEGNLFARMDNCDNLVSNVFRLIQYA